MIQRNIAIARILQQLAQNLELDRPALPELATLSPSTLRILRQEVVYIASLLGARNGVFCRELQGLPSAMWLDTIGPLCMRPVPTPQYWTDIAMLGPAGS
jgi:hypothetical protein